MKRMKYFFLLLVVLSLVLATIPFSPVSAAGEIVSIGPAVTEPVPGGTISPGATFYVDVNINMVTNLGTGQYAIAYNPAVIQIVGPEGGPAGVTDGVVGGTDFGVAMWSYSPVGTPGATIVLQAVDSVLFPATGTGYLARVHFQALPGTAGLSSFINFVDLPSATPPFTRGLWNNMSLEITGVTWTNGSVSIVAPPPPER